MARSNRIPPHVFFLVSSIFHYLGPAFAVLLFARIAVLGVAWLRIASAALILGAWRKPWRAYSRLDPSGRSTLILWGTTLAVMNCCFSESIDSLPSRPLAHAPCQP